jgi:hypothetical protein
VDSALGAGFSWLRAIGEMTWALRAEPRVDRLLEYKAKLSDFFRDNDIVTICKCNCSLPVLILGKRD